MSNWLDKLNDDLNEIVNPEYTAYYQFCLILRDRLIANHDFFVSVAEKCVFSIDITFEDYNFHLNRSFEFEQILTTFEHALASAHSTAKIHFHYEEIVVCALAAQMKLVV